MFNIEPVLSNLKPKSDILALGTDTYQRVSWSKNGKIFSLTPKSEFIDLKEFYFKAAKFLINTEKLNPRFIAFDPHPYFNCNKEAQVIQRSIFPAAKCIAVFHHRAHLANFAIEVGKNKEFLGLAFDGTGFGEDSKIWGSEFFVYSGKSFKRVAHFDYLALVGNEAAIREPWRVGLAVLYKIFGEKVLGMRLDFLKGIDLKEQKLIIEMLNKNFNTAYSCGAGRYFDAVSAILNIKPVVKNEAEAAIALEKEAAKETKDVMPYSFDVRETKDGLCVDFSQMFKELAGSSFVRGENATAARRFHQTLAYAIARVCRILEEKNGIKLVYASGGVFMNNILINDLKNILKEDGFDIVFAKRPATTDIGISQGQIAACVMEKN